MISLLPKSSAKIGMQYDQQLTQIWFNYLQFYLFDWKNYINL